MTTIEVWVNHQKVCTAGHVEADTLQASLFLVPAHDHRFLSVSVKTEKSAKLVRDLRWCERELRLGDEVRLVLKESAAVDSPESEREFGSSVQRLQATHSCSFCGRRQDQVKRLTLGFGGNICIDCATLASEDAA